MDKLNDCYFYYYSTCTKGKKCPFRHCDLALGSEVVCEAWRIGRCKDLQCTFRHMEPNIKRATIACWFESQPSGCKKPHCVFQHNKPRPSITDLQKGQDLILPMTVNAAAPQDSNQPKTTPIDGNLVVKPSIIESKLPPKSEFNLSIDRGEESDDQENNFEEPVINENEVKVKTLEQIRMEKILNSSPDEAIQETVNHNSKPNETYPILRRQVKTRISHSAVTLIANNSKLKPSPDEEERLKAGKQDCVFGQGRPKVEKPECTLEPERPTVVKQDHKLSIKSLHQIRQERPNEGDASSSGAEEKPTCKENQAPNLLKRAFEPELEVDHSQASNAKPVKLRRTRISTSANIAPSVGKCDSNSRLNGESVSENGNSVSVPATSAVIITQKAEPVDDFDLDDLGIDSSPTHGNPNIDDDELMREIESILN